MKIQYLGHSCFKLTESTGTTVITDPYGGIGYELPKGLKADAVTEATTILITTTLRRSAAGRC